MYTYVHNLQGDIVGILNGSGAVVVEYSYDAWGRPTGVTGSMATTLGEINPFRYRGYVYDEETGLYYLRSRYYNPVWQRFVNGDKITELCIFGVNSYAYCENDPIQRRDLDGCISSYALNDTLHDIVVNEIADKYGFEFNVYVTDLAEVSWRKTTNGFIDLYDRDNNEVYEVKKATIGEELFLRQLNRYSGTTIGGKSPSPGTKIIAGSIDYLDYLVCYYSVAPGQIAYEAFNKHTAQPVPIPSRRAEKNVAMNRERYTNYSRIPVSSPSLSLGDIGKLTLIAAIGIMAFALTGDPSVATGLLAQY